ncbi:hypothetical protein [Clostridium sp. UBA1652]|uniref:hypothetical protein n=1 Tax=Clostridium sp. UBA1652 TaxID=1946348 RepID=UPI00257BE867|nr:hypothetical protein [Clostridium sp. UBA1652]
MIKRQKDFIIKVFASVIFAMAIYLPSDRYILRGAGLVIFNTIIFKDDIKNLLLKGNKKDIIILAIVSLMFLATIFLPNIHSILKIIIVLIFDIILLKDKIKHALSKSKKEDVL